MRKLFFQQKIMVALIALGAITQNVNAMLVYDPWNMAQNMATAGHTAKQLINEAQQLQLALQDIKNYAGGIGGWANIQSLLQQLGGEIQQGQALAYSMQNLDSAFQTKFPGFTAPQNYGQSYNTWLQTTLDTLRGTLDSVGLQSNAFGDEQMTLNTLSGLSQTAQGRMQAVQVGNMIATQQVAQLQQLRQLVMAQTNAESTYAAAQVQEKAADEATVTNWINNGDTTFPPYGRNQDNK